MRRQHRLSEAGRSISNYLLALIVLLPNIAMCEIEPEKNSWHPALSDSAAPYLLQRMLLVAAGPQLLPADRLPTSSLPTAAQRAVWLGEQITLETEVGLTIGYERTVRQFGKKNEFDLGLKWRNVPPKRDVTIRHGLSERRDGQGGFVFPFYSNATRAIFLAGKDESGMLVIQGAFDSTFGWHPTLLCPRKIARRESWETGLQLVPSEFHPVKGAVTIDASARAKMRTGLLEGEGKVSVLASDGVPQGIDAMDHLRSSLVEIATSYRAPRPQPFAVDFAAFGADTKAAPVTTDAKKLRGVGVAAHAELTSPSQHRLERTVREVVYLEKAMISQELELNVGSDGSRRIVLGYDLRKPQMMRIAPGECTLVVWQRMQEDRYQDP
jgi:hypothetical protein